MSEKHVRELLVIHQSGLPIGHVGTGQIQIDDALFGGLLSAIDNVGQSFGIGADGTLDSIGFKAYDLVYARTSNGLVVLLTNTGTHEFYQKAKEELQAIGDAIEAQGFLADFYERSSEMVSQVDEIIRSKARTIFAKQDDVFVWDDEHSFQLAEYKNERWHGEKLFSNYLMLSPLIGMIRMPMDDLKKLCDVLKEKHRPSEIVTSPSIQTRDEDIILHTMRFLHQYGLIYCFGSTIQK